MAHPFLFRPDEPARARGSRQRHRRSPRGPVTGPTLPLLSSRESHFDMIATGVFEYLRMLWPSDLAAVALSVADVPAVPTDHVQRYDIDVTGGRITLYRVPITRLARLHIDDAFHRQLNIEQCVVAAVAEYLGRDPWEVTSGEPGP